MISGQFSLYYSNSDCPMQEIMWNIHACTNTLTGHRFNSKIKTQPNHEEISYKPKLSTSNKLIV